MSRTVTSQSSQPSVSASNKPADLFQKCRDFTRADEVKAAGFYPYFRAIEENEGPVVMIEGRKIIMAGSNNNLWLTAPPKVKEAPTQARVKNAAKLIVTDGVFSTTGEIVDLPDLVRIAEKHNAKILVDDAHAIGVIGKGGRGTASHFGLGETVDMVMGTFSKTFASLGGFVVGGERTLNYLKHH